MFKTALDCNILNKKELMNLKTKALRSGAWFETLRRIERVFFHLTKKL